MQSASHPSPPSVLLSSHASAVERTPLPQMWTTGATVTASPVELLRSSSVVERLPVVNVDGVEPDETTLDERPTLSRRRRLPLVVTVDALTSMGGCAPTWAGSPSA